MKKHFIHAALLCLSALFLFSCKDDETPVELSVATPTDIIAEGGSAEFTVQSTVAWTLTKGTDANWLTSVSPTSGSGDANISVSAGANTSTTARTATLTITAGNVTKSVNIKQLGLVIAPIVATGNITGDATNTCPATTVALSVSNISGATSYQWYNASTAITGATTQTYTVTASGSYSVTGVNAAGEGPKSTAKTVTITNCSGGDGRNYADLLGNYTAAGTPNFLKDPGAASWSCEIKQPTDGATDYYGVTNWGNKVNSIFIDIVNDSLFILQLNLGNSETHNAILTAFYIKDSTLYYIEKYPITWDATSKTVNMSGKVGTSDVMVGILAFSIADGTLAGAFSDCYINAILTMNSAGAPSLLGTKKTTAQSFENLMLKPFNGIKHVVKVKFDAANFSRK